MKLVYIAGPYRAKTTVGVKRNIERAESVGMYIATSGRGILYPVIPHTNTAFWDGLRDAQYFVDGTLEMMRRCDAVMIVPGIDISQSVGTIGEIDDAKRTGLPVFTDYQKLWEWAGIT